MEKPRNVQLEDTKKQEKAEISKVLEESLNYEAIPEDEHVIHSRCYNIRLKVGILIQSRQFQIAIIILVIVDVIIVLWEILLSFHILDIGKIGNTVEKVLKISSLSILSLFLLEIIVKLLIFRLLVFHHKAEVFDGLVVIISFVFDIIESEVIRREIQLLIAFRLWKVARVISGIVISAQKKEEKNIKKARDLREAVEQEFLKHQVLCSTLKARIEFLKKLLEENGIRVSEDSDGSDVMP